MMTDRGLTPDAAARVAALTGLAAIVGRGGLGFILGDGRLNYGREVISETYYDAHVVSGLYMAVQLSFINNPGYNRDRGPVVVPGVRAHVDF